MKQFTLKRMQSIFVMMSLVFLALPLDSMADTMGHSDDRQKSVASGSAVFPVPPSCNKVSQKTVWVNNKWQCQEDAFLPPCRYIHIRQPAREQVNVCSPGDLRVTYEIKNPLTIPGVFSITVHTIDDTFYIDTVEPFRNKHIHSGRWCNARSYNIGTYQKSVSPGESVMLYLLDHHGWEAEIKATVCFRPS